MIAYASHHPIIADILTDEDGAPFCPEPASCDVCMLLQIPTDPEARSAWTAQVRRMADEPLAINRGLPLRVAGYTPADRRLLAVLTDTCSTADEIAQRLGIGVGSVGKAISDARRRGAPIVTKWRQGYRLMEERAG